MNSLQDVVYNWLTIKLIADSRPKDLAAQDTTAFFWKMLYEEHNVKDIHVEKKEEMYEVVCILMEKERKFRFPIELIECIRDQVHNEPEKFQIYD